VRSALCGIVDGLRVSTAISLATAPDLAETVGRTSLLAPWTNLASAIPSFGALGWGAVAGLAPIPEVAAHVLARAGRQSAGLLLALCRASASLPGADVAITPLPAAAACGCAALGVFSARARGPGPLARRALLLGAALAALRAGPSFFRERITFLDVGQGDAVLVESGRRAVLIDAGPPDDDPIRAVTGRTQVGDACLRRGIARVDAAILSHGHLDHAGAFAAMLRAGAARALLVPPRPAAERAPELVVALEAIADSAGIARGPAPWPAHPRRLLGGALVSSSAWSGEPPLGTEENDLSIVARFRTREWDALVTGDLEEAGERALLENRSPLTSPVWLLKAGHHGGRTSTSDALLDRVRPRVVVFSCGARNPHGHPHEDVLARCRTRGAIVLRTDREGTISVTRTTRGARVRWERAHRPDAGLGSSAGFP
jgi:competence protein ComEC